MNYSWSIFIVFNKIPLLIASKASRNSSHAELPAEKTSTSWACTRVLMSAHWEVVLLWRSRISLPGSNSAYSSKLQKISLWLSDRKIACIYCLSKVPWQRGGRKDIWSLDSHWDRVSSLDDEAKVPLCTTGRLDGEERDDGKVVPLREVEDLVHVF